MGEGVLCDKPKQWLRRRLGKTKQRKDTENKVAKSWSHFESRKPVNHITDYKSTQMVLPWQTIDELLTGPLYDNIDFKLRYSR